MELDCCVLSTSIGIRSLGLEGFPIFETGLCLAVCTAPYGKPELLLFLRGHSSISTVNNSQTNGLVKVEEELECYPLRNTNFQW